MSTSSLAPRLAHRLATPGDGAALARLGRRTFIQTFVDEFARAYPADDLAAYIDRFYRAERFAAFAADPAHRLWLVEDPQVPGEAIAYAWAGPAGLPHPDCTAADGELRQLYIDRPYQGRRLGRSLLEAALAWLDPAGRRTLWLGVWSGNLKAQRLYQAAGFVQAGTYGFQVGSATDLEFIYRRVPTSA